FLGASPLTGGRRQRTGIMVQMPTPTPLPVATGNPSDPDDAVHSNPAPDAAHDPATGSEAAGPFEPGSILGHGAAPAGDDGAALPPPPRRPVSRRPLWARLSGWALSPWISLTVEPANPLEHAP